MPQRQHHRGQHPEDARLFAQKWIPTLRAAVVDVSFLLTRNYSRDAALRLVGGHYQLDARQRRAVLRTACSDASLRRRAAHRIGEDGLNGQALVIDGYNLLITAESILGDAILLRGRDGCVRDMASMHGSYRKVEETAPAIQLIGETLQPLPAARIQWFFDAPVSNSGRLRATLCQEAETHGWSWQVDVADNVDRLLAESSDIVVTSDGWILDHARRWFNVTELILAKTHAAARVIDLGDTSHPQP